MVTMATVAAIIGMGIYANHAQWKTRIVLLVCTAMLAMGIGADLVLEQPPSRFNMN